MVLIEAPALWRDGEVTKTYVDGVAVRCTVEHTVTLKEITPATKPANPAFINALRPRRLRIGLRYLGD